MAASMVRVLAMCVAMIAAESAQVTPIQKVLMMMQEMRAKGEDEMKGEEVTFTSFAGWCKNTAGQREKSIAKGELQMSQLAADI